MNSDLAHPTRWLFTACLSCLLCVSSLAFLASGAHAQDAAALESRYSALRGQLASSPFKQPLVLESAQTSDTLKGNIYAVVRQPYSLVRQALEGRNHWCDILILHLNVKNCRALDSGSEKILSVAIGRKFDQPIADAYPVDFIYRIAASGPGYLDVLLHADKGPLDTKDYRIALEAIPLTANTSFLHMSYAYAYGLAARIAVQAYLATLGRDKVGFSVVSHNPDGSPVYVGNVRGMLERNTMRYYLAIEVYLNTYTLPPGEQPEKRLEDWFSSVERYPRQLHELDRDEYLSMKRKELARQKTAVNTGEK